MCAQVGVFSRKNHSNGFQPQYCVEPVREDPRFGKRGLKSVRLSYSLEFFAGVPIPHNNQRKHPANGGFAHAHHSGGRLLDVQTGLAMISARLVPHRGAPATNHRTSCGARFQNGGGAFPDRSVEPPVQKNQAVLAAGFKER